MHTAVWRFSTFIIIALFCRVNFLQTAVWRGIAPCTDVHTSFLMRPNLIRTSIEDKYSGSMKLTAHLDISPCKTASGTNWSNGWTYRVFIINTRRDSTPIRRIEPCTETEVSEGGMPFMAENGLLTGRKFSFVDSRSQREGMSGPVGERT